MPTQTESLPPSLVRDRNFLKFWTGQAISQFGTQLGHLALPVIAVLLLGASEFEVGVLNASATAAFLIVGLPAGAWVDRWLKRRVMIAADLVRMVAMLAVPLLWWLDVLGIWHLCAVAGVVGIATVFFDVAYQSYVPVLVRGDQVPSANSKLESTAQISRLGGPAAAGGLLQIVSTPLLFLGQSVGYLVSAVFLVLTQDQEQRSPAADRLPIAAEIKEGLVFVVRHQLIRRVAACTAGVNFFATLIFTLLPLLILRDLDLGAAALGLILSLAAVGGLLGAVATPWIAERVGEGTLIPVASLTSSAFLVLIPLAALAPSKPVAIVLLIVGEAGMTFCVLAYNIMQVSMRQRVCPPRLLGRMNASIRCVIWGVMPIAGLLAGVLGAQLGVVPTMWIGVAGTVVAAIPVLGGGFIGMRKLPDTVATGAS
ncbi:MFS transporter [Arthrobacter sp. H20]|uniref:MFS transporter n=1 Tax=Arthrobacter sp. H20 TaxID=1267981 RepID=UPI00047EF6F0|nr:MFS transporter [Arthrobacter sp. H20]